METIRVTAVSFKEAKQLLTSLNPTLCEYLKPKSQYIKIAYSFGQRIFEKGLWHGKLPFSPSIAIILKNTVEIFVELEHQNISLKMLGAGDVFELGPTKTTAMAGARNMFMLAKISEHIAHLKIQKAFGSTLPTPRDGYDHHAIFKNIFHKTHQPDEWEVEILFLADISKNTNELSHLDAILNFKIIWHHFIKVMHKKNKKIAPHVLDLLKSLLLSSLGFYPLFAPACDNSVGPIKTIQKIYLEIYGLAYAPIVMTPALQQFPRYFSIKHANVFESFIKNAHNDSLITDLVHLHSALQAFLNFNESLPLSELNFTFYHTAIQGYQNILSLEALQESDVNFMRDWEGLAFPYSNQYLKSCVQVRQNTLRNKSP